MTLVTAMKRLIGIESEVSPLDHWTWSSDVLGRPISMPNTWPATSWPADTEWGLEVERAMSRIEIDYAATLLSELDARGIRGPVVEFGVYSGNWLLTLVETCERLGLQRSFFGFDSFTGLPKPTGADLDCFREGQFEASFESVFARLDCDRRTNVKLIRGWFQEALATPEARTIEDVSYARVDCDLYASAVECLDFLGSRLADGAILVFDDWTFDLAKGETRAFAEWVPRVPHLGFEFLCFNAVGHLYLRVRHR